MRRYQGGLARCGSNKKVFVEAAVRGNYKKVSGSLGRVRAKRIVREKMGWARER